MWALRAADKLKEQAKIEKETAEINYQKAKVEAQTVKTLADAEAYKKKVILQADNALAQKLEVEVEIQKLWADAYAKRKVPTNVLELLMARQWEMTAKPEHLCKC